MDGVGDVGRRGVVDEGLVLRGDHPATLNAVDLLPAIHLSRLINPTL